MTTNHAVEEAVPQEPATESRLFTARSIRSFTLRQGRITVAQEKALETLWPDYGLECEAPFLAAEQFGRTAPLIVEIGFGNGETLAHMAEARPEFDFLGIEVHSPGIGHLLMRIRERALTNVRIFRADAVWVLSERIPDATLAGIHVFFPDPWPKARHHKRRLVNAEFLRLAARKLAVGGRFHAASDWEDYALQMQGLLEANPDFRNTTSGFAPRPLHRPETKFEQRGKRLGHGVFDLLFERI